MIRKLFIAVGLLFWLLSLSAQTGTFRFAQLTDIHLNHDKPEPIIDLLSSIAQINATDSLDFVLVTGDLSEEGDRETLMRVKKCLDLLRYKYYVVMGNHETKWSESGCTAYSNIFGGERFSFTHKGFQFLGFNSGPLMRMAYGHVGPQDIAWIKQSIKNRQQPVILVTHYPMLERDVDNWYDVTDAVRPYNIRLFIGGHYHRNKNFRYDGIPGVLMRSNLRDKDGLSGYGLYEVTQDSIIVYEQRVGEKKHRLHAFSLTANYFDHQGKADKYPDYSVNQQYTQVKRVWLTQSASAMYASPAVEGSRIFVGDDTGYLSAYQLKNGKRLWQFKSGARIVGTPAVAEGIVVFGSADKNIYALNAKDGSERWRIQASEPVLGAVSIENGIAYIGASDHIFRAIDIKTGKIKWTYNEVKGYVETKPLLADGKVIFGAWDNTLYALDKETGKECWKWTGGLTRMHFSPAAVWPVAAHGKVFITDPQRAMTAIDIETGKTLWRTFRSMVRESIGLSEDKQRLYGKTMQDSMVCYSATAEQPQEIWASNIGFGYEHAPSMHPEKEGVVYGSTKEGLIFALEPKTGKVIWKHKIGNSLINTVVPLSGHRLLVTATSGEICLLKF